MEDDILERMRRERADLRRKLEAVETFLAAYGEPASKGDAEPAKNASVRPQPARSEPGGARDKKPIDNFSEYGRKIIAHAMALMVGRTSPTKTRDLVVGIENMGQEIRGENKINALGALLGRSADIHSHGKMGWTLANPETAEQIVGKYVHEENEPPSVSAGGSDAAGEGAPPPDPAQIHSYWGREA